jgi:predicted NBD/HSP70 family sugar kinase
VKEVNVEHQKGDQGLVRSQNRALVINLLRTSGPMSRADIAKQTGLAPSALTRLMRILIEEGVVEEVGKANSSGGRPATLVGLNQSHSSSVGIKIERRRVLAARVDLGGVITHRAESPIGDPPNPEETLRTVGGLIDDLLEDRILGIGVCVSGFVDPLTGANLYSPILKWENVPILDLLAARFDVPIRVENDVNALALAECWYGAGASYQNFVCITVGEGIGAGVVIGGNVYHGAYGGAGELGHITIDPNGPVCRCRERGCLEVYASDRFLEEEADRLGFGSIDRMIAAARDGAAEARDAFTQMGRNLGIGAKNLVNLLNPEAIVLGGERMDEDDLFFGSFVEEVRRHSFPAEAAQLEIVPATLGRDGFLIGAATLAAVEFFRLPAQVSTT